MLPAVSLDILASLRSLMYARARVYRTRTLTRMFYLAGEIALYYLSCVGAGQGSRPPLEDTTMTSRTMKDGTTKMTIKIVRDELRSLGMTLTKDESGDFCVKPRGSYADTDGYFTNDLQDAVNTGRAMYEKICRQIDQINKTALFPFSYPNETSHADR